MAEIPGPRWCRLRCRRRMSRSCRRRPSRSRNRRWTRRCRRPRRARRPRHGGAAQGQPHLGRYAVIDRGRDDIRLRLRATPRRAIRWARELVLPDRRVPTLAGPIMRPSAGSARSRSRWIRADDDGPVRRAAATRRSRPTDAGHQVFELLARACEQRVPLLIVDTIRTQAQQVVNVAAGVSWTMHSKHLPQPPHGKAQAIDVRPVQPAINCTGRTNWQWDGTPLGRS